MRHLLPFALALVLPACDGGGSPTGGAGGTGNAGGAAGSGGSQGGAAGSAGGGGVAGGAGGQTLSDLYPGDVGIENDPSVVWAENCEEADAAAMVARYDDAKPQGISLDADVPA